MKSSIHANMRLPESILAALDVKPKRFDAITSLPEASKDEISTGQIWHPARPPIKEGSYSLLVVEMLHDGFFNACPAFIWTEKWGPSDTILPKRFGIRMAVSFEMEATFSKECIGACAGVLCKDLFNHVLDCRKYIRNGKTGSRPPQFMPGPEYLDDMDTRFVYHEAILNDIEELQQYVWRRIYANEEIEELQQDVWRRIYANEEGGKTKARSEYIFTVFSSDIAQNHEYALAAKSHEKFPAHGSFSTVKPKGLSIVFTEDSDRLWVYINIFKGGEPSSSLDGATVFDSKSGTALGKISNGNAKIQKDKFQNNIWIEDASGRPVQVRVEKMGRKAIK